jgi:transposase
MAPLTDLLAPPLAGAIPLALPAKGFVVLPRRWAVERTLAWLSRNRRLAKDFEQTIASATAWLFIASVQLFTRRITRP